MKKDDTLILYIPKDLKLWLKHYVVEKGTSMSEVVRDLLDGKRKLTNETTGKKTT